MQADRSILARQFAVVIALIAMIAGAWLAPLDSAANTHIDAGLKRALVSFATARALNGVISVAQATQVAIEPGGVGVNLAPGELLDPLNDLVEQFSNLMLGASVAFGVEKILVNIGAHRLVSGLLSVAALLWAAFHLRRHASPAVLSRSLLLLLMIRFALPISLIGSDLMFRQFMQDDYQVSQQAIDATSARLDQQSPTTPGEPASMLDKFKGWVTQNADLKARFTELRQAAEDATAHVIKLMAIFLLQTLILPVLLLWLLWQLARRSFSVPANVRSLDAPDAFQHRR